MRRVPFLSVLCLAALSTAPAQERSAWPTRGWPETTPRAVGLNAAVLDSIHGEIGEGRYGYVDRMLVIRRGQVAFDRSYRQDYQRVYGDSAKKVTPLSPHDLTGPYNYFNTWWHPTYRRGDLHTLQSVTKTITSILIGIAVTRGEFPGIDTPVLSFFHADSVANVDDRKRRLTIRHLLTMTGGFDWNENLPYFHPQNAAVNMEASYDWIGFTINRPMAREPGAAFNYSSGETELLAHIFRLATRTDIEEYAARHLFAPLGIERWFWKRTPAGLVDTEGGLYLEARDLAKVWHLFLRNGVWEGRQVVSPEWVRQSVTPAVATSAAPRAARYGFKWWLHQNPRDTTRLVWAGSGFGGQLPVAIPEDDLIVVFYGWNILPGGQSLPLRRTLERILGAVTDRGM